MSKREEKRLWESLLAHPGWKMLEALCDSRISNIASDVLRPVLSSEEMLERNALSGEILGMNWVLERPQQQAEMLGEDLRRLEVTGELEDEEPTA